MIDPKDLTAAEQGALRRIGFWKLKRKRNGYGLFGESWVVTDAMVSRLRRKRLVSLLPGARHPVILTGEGRNTLAVMDERARARKEAIDG